MSLKIDKLSWGKVRVGREDYHQVLIYGGKVEERDGVKLEDFFGTTHRVGDWEIKKLSKGDPEAVIIASGWSGVLEVTEEDQEKFGNANLRVLKSEEAVEEYNRLVGEGRKVNILVHTTC